MELIQIVLKDLKKFIRQKKVIFFILLLSLVISSYGFLFFTSSNMNVLQIMNSYKGISNNFFIGKQNMTKEEIDETLTYIQTIDSNIVYHIFSSIVKGDEIQEVNDFGIPEKKQLYNLIVGSNKTSKSSEDFVGKIMNDDDRKSCSRYIMLKDTGHLATNDIFIINKQININNKNYTVKALDQLNINLYKYINYISPSYENFTDFNDIEVGIIPDTTFFQEKYDIYGLEIVTSKDITDDNKTSISKFLQEKFKDETILLPQQGHSSLSNINFYTVLYLILILMALVNIMALFTYWLDKNWRKYMIYRLCGAENFQIYKIIMLEAIIIDIIAIIISLIMYYLSIPLLKYLSINYILNITEILITTSLIFILVAINVHIIARKIIRKETRYLGRK